MSSLRRSTSAMAVGTVASRLTGFLRTAAIAAVLGVQGVGVAYNVANTTPNIVYDLLLGGILSSVLVPLLVRAAKEDGDGGEAYAQRLLSLTIYGLGTATVALVVFAPALIALYAANMSAAEQHLALVFARYFLPQILFYGVGAVIGAILNTRDRFAAPMWAPVLNNVVVLLTCVGFVLLSGTSRLTASSLTGREQVLLGVGTTLGIVAQTVALIPSLRAAGFRFRLRMDLRGTGLGAVGRLARWVLVYVAANQVAFWVIVRLSSDDDLNRIGRGYASYANAFVLWQLPHAIVAVSVITALLPRMSAAAADLRIEDLRQTLNRGLRLSIALLVPAAAGFVVLGPALATVIFAHLQTSIQEASYIGTVLSVFAFGLVPFSLYQLQLRAFYAMGDTRTPTLINLSVNLTTVLVGVALFWLLPDRFKVAGLAAGTAASFLVGLAVCSRVLAGRLDGLDAGPVVQALVRCLTAVAGPGLLAALLAALLGRTLGSGVIGSLVSVVAGGSVLLGGYVVLARRMRVRELDEVVGPVLARLGR